MNKKNLGMLMIALFVIGTIFVHQAHNQPLDFTDFQDVLISFDEHQVDKLQEFLQEWDITVLQEYKINAMHAMVPSPLLPLLQLIPGISVSNNDILTITGMETDRDRYAAEAIPNDPSYSQLWGMEKIEAPAAWDIRTDATPVVVAVIDEGLQINHPDLAGNVWTNPGEIAGNGIDDDNNGYIDDMNGWDFVSNDASVYDGSSDDHGTHVAGTIGAVGNNGVGIAGVAWNVELMSLKFLGATGGSTADAITAIEYATAMGADIISASWGGGGYSQALKDAIDAFPGLFVAAAGNDGVDNDVSPHYPSSYTSTNLIAVASSTSTDAMSSFSNYGVASVDIGAPGSSIYSTLPGNSYGSYSGTSMATPHVSGAAAILLADDPTMTPQQLKQKLMDYADPVTAFSGKVVSGARLNLFNSLTGTTPPPPPPPPPTTTTTFTDSITSTSGDNVHIFSVPELGDISATLSWPSSADIDMFLYRPGADPFGAGWVTRAYTLNNPETMNYAADVTGDWQIRVNHYSGVSADYTLEVVHPTSANPDTEAPSQVTGLSAIATGETSIDLSWSPATDNVGVSGYNIFRDGVFLSSTSATSYTDTGLTASTTYSYTVSALDAAGNEGLQSSAASATTDSPPPADTEAPSQVTGLTATASGETQIDLNWNAATDNVGVVSYNIYRDGVLVGSSSSTSFSDTGLTASTTYSYTVSALDAAANEGLQSSAVSATTDSPPPPPTETEMYVADITPYGQYFWWWLRLYVDVTILDANGLAVQGAVVSLEVTTPSGSISTLTATTNANGVATFDLGWASSGGYTVTVTNVVATDYAYNSDLNIETSVSFTVS